MLCGDDIALMHLQTDDQDVSALDISESLASDCLGVLDRGDPGEPPILSTAKSTCWGVNLSFLGWDTNAHTGWTSFPYENIDIPSDLLDEWPVVRQTAPAKEF